VKIPSSLRGEMTSKWPSVNGRHDGFWKHEYCKHGTCAADVLRTSTDYFSKTLDLYDTVARYLGAKGLNRGGRYDFSKVEGALGKKGRYSCVQSGGRQYLKELGYCYTVTRAGFYPRDCSARGNCDRSKVFYLK
jgi:ribonuclease T2